MKKLLPFVVLLATSGCGLVQKPISQYTLIDVIIILFVLGLLGFIFGER